VTAIKPIVDGEIARIGTRAIKMKSSEPDACILMMPIRRIVMMDMVLVLVPAVPCMVIVVIPMVVIPIRINDLDSRRPDNHRAWRPDGANLTAAAERRDSHRADTTP
jgi:hypothetical protein